MEKSGHGNMDAQSSQRRVVPAAVVTLLGKRDLGEIKFLPIILKNMEIMRIRVYAWESMSSRTTFDLIPDSIPFLSLEQDLPASFSASTREEREGDILRTGKLLNTIFLECLYLRRCFERLL